MARHRSGQYYNSISKALIVPMPTVASIIVKWKIFGNTLSQVGHLVKISNWARRLLDREVTKQSL